MTEISTERTEQPEPTENAKNEPGAAKADGPGLLYRLRWLIVIVASLEILYGAITVTVVFRDEIKSYAEGQLTQDQRDARKRLQARAQASRHHQASLRAQANAPIPKGSQRPEIYVGLIVIVGLFGGVVRGFLMGRSIARPRRGNFLAGLDGLFKISGLLIFVVCLCRILMDVHHGNGAFMAALDAAKSANVAFGFNTPGAVLTVVLLPVVAFTMYAHTKLTAHRA
jgi:hypothetical protein